MLPEIVTANVRIVCSCECNYFTVLHFKAGLCRHFYTNTARTQLGAGSGITLGVLRNTFMCCLLPRFSNKMLATDDIADARAVISHTSDISKGSAGAIEGDGDCSNDATVVDDSPPSPITPSPRQTNGIWQRPAQVGTDSTGQASTSDSNEHRIRLRWAINIKIWSPWDDEWFFLLDMLPEAEQKEVRFESDAALLQPAELSHPAPSIAIRQYICNWRLSFTWLSRSMQISPLHACSSLCNKLPYMRQYRALQSHLANKDFEGVLIATGVFSGGGSRRKGRLRRWNPSSSRRTRSGHW